MIATTIGIKMVKNKESEKSNLLYWIEEQYQEKLAREIVSVRWYVVEKTPSRHVHSEYDSGSWTSEKHVVVSPYFENEKSAKDWLNKHDPDDGNTLYIDSQNKRKWTEIHEEWVNY